MQILIRIYHLGHKREHRKPCELDIDAAALGSPLLCDAQYGLVSNSVGNARLDIALVTTPCWKGSGNLPYSSCSVQCGVSYSATFSPF